MVINFMNEVYAVKIDYCYAGIFGTKEVEKSEIKLFSTKEEIFERYKGLEHKEITDIFDKYIPI